MKGHMPGEACSRMEGCGPRRYRAIRPGEPVFEKSIFPSAFVIKCWTLDISMSISSQTRSQSLRKQELIAAL